MGHFVSLGQDPEKIYRTIDLYHQAVEHFRSEGLGSVTKCLFRIIVNLDHKTIGTGCNRC